jgi:carboxypeptidase C (cathepsin A)
LTHAPFRRFPYEFGLSPYGLSVCGCPGSFRWAINAQKDKPAEKTAASDKSSEPAASDVTTQGEVDAGGQHIAYNAIAGIVTVGATDVQDAQLGNDGRPLPGTQLALSEPKDSADAPPVARMFYVAYFKKDSKSEDRPITFFYNGGPGSSTVWLHMGSLGPKYVETDGDQHQPAAPYKLLDNPNSLLDASDLVFVDAPGTGFGRACWQGCGESILGRG